MGVEKQKMSEISRKSEISEDKEPQNKSHKQKQRMILLILCTGAAVVLAAIGGRYLYQQSQGTEYLFVMNDIRNYDDYNMFMSFENQISTFGSTAEVLDSEEQNYSAMRQIQDLKEKVSSRTSCILVNGAGNSSVSEELQEYMAQGIQVISCISEVDPQSRMLHIGPSDEKKLGIDMYAAGAEYSDGKGRFALVSPSSQSVLASSLIQQLRYSYEEREHPGMLMEDIVFQPYEEDACDGIKNLLTTEEKTDYLLCLSENLTKAACQAVTELGLEEETAVIGLGNPDYLEEELQNEKLKLKIFYCDMDSFGAWAAEIAYKAVAGELTGAAGETVIIDGADYTVKDDSDDNGGTVLYMYDAYRTLESGDFGKMNATQN